MSGTADCEVRDDWFLEQDVNAWSSLAYLAAGVIMAVQVFRHRLPAAAYGLAAVVAVEGAGSLLYHGAAGDASQFLHDVPLIAALGFVAGWHAGRLVAATDRGSLVGLVVGLATASVLWAVAPGATNATVAVAIVVIVATSVAARRRGLVGVWSPALLVLGAVAVAMWALGSPDSPLCSTESVLQPHALWHVLTAVLALAWVDSAYAAADPDHAPRMFRRFADRTIGMLAGGLVLGFHRSVDVAWSERFPADRPVLVVANSWQRLRRSGGGGRSAQASPAIPRQGGVVEGGGRPTVPRARRSAARLPQRRRRPVGQQRVGVRGHAIASWRRVRPWRSSPRGRRVTAPDSTA